MAPSRIYLEKGKHVTFACAIDWPGWSRKGRGEQDCIEALLSYGERYASVVGEGFDPGPVEIIGRIDGNATTDFGAPSAIGPWDAEPLLPQDLDRHVSILEASWRAFDVIVANAPPLLRKGPRGGGRDTAAIAAHVREAERVYARKVGARIPTGTALEEHRKLICTALRSSAPTAPAAPAAPIAPAAWPVRYVIRRMTWHVLDHTWEIEDKSEG